MPEKFALAFVHLPTGEVGRSEFIFTNRREAQDVCDELDRECSTILHFVIGEHDNLRILAGRRKERGPNVQRQWQ